MATLAGTLARLDEEQKGGLDVVLVTTDPARDRRATVQDYVEAFDPSIIGSAGDLDDVVSVAASMKVAIGPDDGVDTYWGADVSQDQLTHDVTMLLDQR